MKQPLSQIAFDFFSQEEPKTPPAQPAVQAPQPPPRSDVPNTVQNLPATSGAARLPEQGEQQGEEPQEGYASGVRFRIKSLKKAPVPEQTAIPQPEETTIPAISPIPPEAPTSSRSPIPLEAPASSVVPIPSKALPEKPVEVEIPAEKQIEKEEAAKVEAAKVEMAKEESTIGELEKKEEVKEEFVLAQVTEEQAIEDAWLEKTRQGATITGESVTETQVLAAPEKALKSKRGRKSLKQTTAEADLIEIPDDEVLFRKQYYTIGEVAEMFRVNQSLLRFWETEFHMLKPRKNKKGDRYFRPADIKSLHLIYHLLRQRKYTIEGAKEFLKNNKKSENRFEAIQRLQEVKAFLLEWKAQL